jgi:hypothetical protein
MYSWPKICIVDQKKKKTWPFSTQLQPLAGKTFWKSVERKPKTAWRKKVSDKCRTEAEDSLGGPGTPQKRRGGLAGKGFWQVSNGSRRKGGWPFFDPFDRFDPWTAWRGTWHPNVDKSLGGNGGGLWRMAGQPGGNGPKGFEGTVAGWAWEPD